MTRFVLAAGVSAGVCVIVDMALADILARSTLLGMATAAGWFALAPRDPHRLLLSMLAAVVGTIVCTAIGASPALALGGVWGLSAPIFLQPSSDGFARTQTLLLSLAGAHIGMWMGLQALDPTLTSGMAGITLLTASTTLLGSAPLYWQSRRQRPTIRQVQVYLAQPYRPAVHSALRLTDRGIQLAPDRATAAGLDEVCAWVFRLQCSSQQLNEGLSLIDESAARHALADSAASDPSDATRTHQLTTDLHHRQVLHHCEVLRAEVVRTNTTVTFAHAWLADAVAGLTVARTRPDDAVAPDLLVVLERLRTHGDVQEAHRRTQREFATPVSAV